MPLRFAAQGTDIAPIFIIVALAFGAWKLISWMLYLSRKKDLDDQIAAGQSSLLGLNQDVDGPTTLNLSGGPDIAAATATLDLYRLRAFAGKLLPVYIYCDRTVIASLDNGSCTVCRVPAGQHVFASSHSRNMVALNMEAGQEYFIRCSGGGTFEAVDRERANAEMDAMAAA